MNSKVRTAVVGCGYWGPNIIRNFHQLPEADLVFVCDTQPERLEYVQENFPGVPVTQNFDEILDDPDIQAVVLTTPADGHYEQTRRVLDAGKHVLVEKPLALSGEQCRELIDLAPGSTRQEQAGFIGRHGGLIFIDEIDKKSKDGRLIGHDISREGFQRAVLKLIESKQVSIYNPMSPSSQIQEAMDRQRGIEPDPMANMISTEKILFILSICTSYEK